MDSNINGSGEQPGYPTNNKQLVRTLFVLIIISLSLAITWRAVFADQRALEVENTFENNSTQLPGVENSSPHNPIPSATEITLRAATGATISFKTQNGNTIDNTPPQRREIPHLVLFRNSELTNANERTLIVTVNNLEVPPTGLTVSLRLETQHGDPDLGGGADNRILVWSETHRIDNSGGATQSDVMVVFEVKFGEAIQSGGEQMTTPTDYYRYDVILGDGNQLASMAQQVISQDYALLVEHQSIVKLSEVGVEKNVGPGEISLYYCHLFPFQKDGRDASTKLSREDIPSYIQTQLLPEMLAAIRNQMSWGFYWDKVWTNLRAEEDPNRLSIALAFGRTWFHGRAPVRGHSGISINVNGGDNKSYDTLTDGLMSTFHHELFHTFQRSINQARGGNGDVAGKDNAWRFFSEGTASLIPSVAQAEVQYSQSGAPRAYLAKAAKFVGGRGFSGDLNNSYAEMTPYRAAIYWRFLYEQCAGMSGDYEDPGAGLQLVRRSLEVLYSKEIVDINSSTNLVDKLPLIMDRVLSSPEAASCPFATYDESLLHFSRAIYALQLDGGRCSTPGVPSGCGFYDPNNLYGHPYISKLSFSGQEIIFGAEDQSFPSGIRSSFGMDFVDIILDSELQGKPLTIEIFANPTGETKFNIQLWKLIDPDNSSRPGSSPRIASPVEIIDGETSAGIYLYTIPEIDTEKYNRLGLIITRLDSNENLDPNGIYTIVLRSD